MAPPQLDVEYGLHDLIFGSDGLRIGLIMLLSHDQIHQLRSQVNIGSFNSTGLYSSKVIPPRFASNRLTRIRALPPGGIAKLGQAIDIGETS